jgi:hypothetical protein
MRFAHSLPIKFMRIAIVGPVNGMRKETFLKLLTVLPLPYTVPQQLKERQPRSKGLTLDTAIRYQQNPSTCGREPYGIVLQPTSSERS